ncbi:ammonium transporter [Stratiformator vulcanicus]|uniref:Sensory/regulatory protein RpfC n=1 Tax=Stratiformator vulcanicus TaxID=2527980 RepID=A0A517R620_9PLAN|nr:ammonium transporter [Stratiformator vulcanicus]QDT39346.1 Signal transduction histidine-protein kinase BarA [Stratiformator vulcanicus]
MPTDTPLSFEDLGHVLWMLIAAAMVMLMQGGFCFLESGLSRAKNSINVAMKNLMDFCLAAVVFWLVGFGLMFGATYNGYVGTSLFAIDEHGGPWLLAFFLFQLVFCGTATTIVSGAVAERMKFAGYLMVSVLVSLIFYPIFGHWVWGGVVPGTDPGWLAEMGFIDFAGSTVVHSVGGWLALAACLVVGPRLGRFTSDRPMNAHNVPMATLGVFLLWFGWFGFNGGSTLEINADIALILVNTNVAAACGGLAGLLASWTITGRPQVGEMLNGVVAGLVGITAGCHMLSPAAAIIVGLVAGALCSLATRVLIRLKIDDVIGAVPAHAVAGAWGTMAVALFANADQFSEGVSRLDQIIVQATGVGVCFAWCFGGGLIVFKAVDMVLPFRVEKLAELQGLNVSEHGASTELIDLLVEMEGHRQRGEFGSEVSVEPHTEVGQVATAYNRVLARVNEEIAAREEVSKALRRAEEKYRGIFENAVEGIYQTSPEGQILDANPAFAKILGFDSPDRLRHRISDVGRQIYLRPERREEFCEAVDRDGEVIGFESEIRRRDGSTCWISENARAVRDSKGKVRFYEGTVEDITDGRDIQQKLRLTQFSIDRASDCVFWLSREGLFLYANEAAAKAYGYEDGELLLRSFADISVEHDSSDAWHAYWNEVKRHGSCVVETVHRTRTGRVFPVELAANYLSFDGNDYLFVYARDITERKRAEVNLQRTNAVLQAQQEAILDGMLILDERQRVVSYNQRYLELWQLPAESMDMPSEERVREYIAPQVDDPVEFLERMHDLNNDPRRTGFDEIELSDGRFLERYTGPVIAPSGETLGRIWSFRDVTEKKRQELLRQEKEAAEAASTAKSSFLANMSHEIRTPLNGVVGMLDLLKLTEIDDRQQRYVSLAKNSAGALLSLINDILDFSKIEAGKLEIEQIPLELRELIEDVADMFSLRAAEKGVELVPRVSSELPDVVKGDPERIRQILINLLGNALKFTEKGTITLEAEPVRHEGKKYFRLAVSDTGIGIPPDRLKSLFSAFTQVDASTTRKYGGTGLGLAICSQLTGLMGGEIGVESEVGHGSTFWLRIPLEAVDDANRPRQEVPEELRGLEVLCIDDHETNLEIFRDQLRSWGLRVQTAESGHEGLERLRNAESAGSPFRLVILDQNMPVMDGLELSAAVRDDETLSGTPLLLATSANAILSPKECQKAGLTGCMTKPIRQSRLREAVIAALMGDRPMAGMPDVATDAAGEAEHATARILVADDHEVNRMVTEEVLTSAGHSVTLVVNGEEAVREAKTQQFDLVLMDCQMPVMDGFDATRHIRMAEDHELLGRTGGRLPVIALTANAVKGDRERCLESGMDGYLTKPIERDKLLEAIRDITDKISDAPVAKNTDDSGTSGSAQPAPSATPPQESITSHDEQRSDEPRRSDELVQSEATAAPIEPEEADRPNSGVIDFEEFQTRCGGDESFMRRILGKFDWRLQAEIEELRSAVDAGRWDDVAKQAHLLKGSSANIAAHELSDAADRLTELSRASSSEAALAAMEEVEYAATRVARTIAATIQQEEVPQS